METDNWYDAIDNKKFKVIKKMIDNGFDVTFDHNYGFRMAAYKGSLKMMTLLLENGANINVGKSYALRTSISQNNIDCVKFLVKWGAEINENSLEIALGVYHDDEYDEDYEDNNEGNTEIAEFLIENGAVLDVKDNELLYKYVVIGDYEFVKFLLEKNIPLHFKDSDYYDDLIDTIIEDEQFEVIETILKMGVEPHKLFSNAMRGKKRMIKLLCEYGMDPTKIKISKLHKLQYSDYDEEISDMYEITEMLLKIGVDPNKLFPYVINGGVDTIKLLYEYGFDDKNLDINKLYEEWTNVKWTPVINVMDNEDYDVVKLLFEMGVETYRLFPFSVHGGIKMMKLLYKCGLKNKDINNNNFYSAWTYFYNNYPSNKTNAIIIFILKNDFPIEMKQSVAHHLFSFHRNANHPVFKSISEAGIKLKEYTNRCF